MTLNHIDLQVPDVQGAALFFERYFGFEHRSSRTSPAVAILGDAHGFVLVLQRKRRDDEAYPEGFHVGFLVESEDLVRAFHERARGEGLVISDLQSNNRGLMTYCHAPGGVLVEVSCRRPRG